MSAGDLRTASFGVEGPPPQASRPEISSFVSVVVEVENHRPTLQSNTEAIFNLLNNALGVSLLAVSWVCTQVGLLPGLSLYAISGFLNRYTLHLIFRSCQLARVKVSYPDVADACFGRLGFGAVASIMTTSMCITCTAYVVTVGAVLLDGFDWEPEESPKAIALGMAFLAPFTLIRSLKRIAVLSTVATFAAIFQLMAIAIPCYWDYFNGITYVDHMGAEPGSILWWDLTPSKVIKVAPVVLLAYSTQASSPVILASLQDNSWENVRRITGLVFSMLYVISALFGHSVYLRFRDLTTDSALTTIGQRPVDQVARWCGFVLVFISYIFMVFPLRNVLMKVLLGKDELEREASFKVFAAVTVSINIFLLMTAQGAQKLGGLSLCLRFGGGFCSTLMAMVFPPLLFVQVRAERGWDARVVCGSRGGLAMLLAIGASVWILSNQALAVDVLKKTGVL
ncbi:unnamed protein product [Effrenium voratum]|nr:unnamed protein product [Effrenium voratum]|mmetsp:Transcript_12543/g.29708  ORF Transcript_12543/g.29708 Transcript_12543/m.29708 type:complete len:453 (-) Transcript_12543:265-1623(-)